MIVIDAGGVLNKRGIASYINSIISGLQELNASVKDVIILMPLSMKGCTIASENFKVVYRPYINQIVWELILVPVYAKIMRATLIHYTGNTGGVFLPNLLNILTVVTIHDVSFLKGSQKISGSKSIKQIIGKLYRVRNTPKIAMNARRVITVSKFAKKDILSEISCDREKVVVIYNSLQDKFLTSINITSKQKKILIVSGNGVQKNLIPTLE